MDERPGDAHRRRAVAAARTDAEGRNAHRKGERRDVQADRIWFGAAAVLLVLAAETGRVREEAFVHLLHDEESEVRDLCETQALRKRGLIEKTTSTWPGMIAAKTIRRCAHAGPGGTSGECRRRTSANGRAATQRRSGAGGARAAAARAGRRASRPGRFLRAAARDGAAGPERCASAKTRAIISSSTLKPNTIAMRD